MGLENGHTQQKMTIVCVPAKLDHVWYPPVNLHRPCQIGVGRLVSTINRSFSGSMLNYQGVLSRMYPGIVFFNLTSGPHWNDETRMGIVRGSYSKVAQHFRSLNYSIIVYTLIWSLIYMYIVYIYMIKLYMLYYISSFCRRMRIIPLVLSQPSLQRGTFWAAGPGWASLGGPWRFHRSSRSSSFQWIKSVETAQNIIRNIIRNIIKYH